MRQKQHISGFTLPEILIALGVIAIIMSTAVPGVSAIIKNNNLASQLNNVVTDVYLARNEAILRDVRVIICRSAEPNSDHPTCGGETKIYTSGYLVFADDGNYNNNIYNEGTDTLIRRGQIALTGVNMRTNWAWNRNLEFNPDGTTNEGGATARMTLCDSRGKSQGRLIEIRPTGIPRMYARDLSTCYP